MAKGLTDEWGFFTPIPEIVIERCAELGVDALALFVYLRYRTHKERGVAYPTYAKIRQDTGLSPRRVSAAAKALEAADLLQRRKRFGQSVVYVLTPPQLGPCSSTPVEELNTASSTPVATSVLHPRETIQDSLNQDSKREEAPRAKPRPRRPLFDAIAQVCQVDPKTSGSSIAKVEQVFLKAGYSDKDVQSFGAWWWRDELRKKRGTPPTIWQLQERIAVVRTGPFAPRSKFEMELEALKNG